MEPLHIKKEKKKIEKIDCCNKACAMDKRNGVSNESCLKEHRVDCGSQKV